MLEHLQRALVTAGVLLLSSCGYHMGGVKHENLAHLDSFVVAMAENNSLEPMAAILLTNAITDTLQRDGTFRLASYKQAGFRVEACVRSVTFESLLVNTLDTYVSTEVSLNLRVRYNVIETATGECIFTQTIKTSASAYNDLGNVQTARENALSYAARKSAEEFAISIGS